MKRALATLTVLAAACSAGTTPPETVPLPPPPVVEPGVLPGIQVAPVLLSEPDADGPVTASTETISPDETTTTTAAHHSASPRPATTTTTSVPAPAPPVKQPTGDAAAESAFVGLINDLRTSRGLPALNVDTGLRTYARNWSDHMASTGSFTHSNISSLLGTWSKVGENIASGAGVAVLFDALVASPGHLENLVNPDYTHLGVGVAVDADGVLWVTQVFGG